MSLMKTLLRDHAGASAVEYALILAILGAALALAATFLGNTIGDSLNASSNSLRTCGGAC